MDTSDLLISAKYPFMDRIGFIGRKKLINGTLLLGDFYGY